MGWFPAIRALTACSEGSFQRFVRKQRVQSASFEHSRALRGSLCVDWQAQNVLFTRPLLKRPVQKALIVSKSRQNGTVANKAPFARERRQNASFVSQKAAFIRTFAATLVLTFRRQPKLLWSLVNRRANTRINRNRGLVDGQGLAEIDECVREEVGGLDVAVAEAGVVELF